MKNLSVLGGLAALAVSALAASPASADDYRYRGSGRSYRSAEHDRHHYRQEREHDRAHYRGFYSGRDHSRWHYNAGEHHDGDHHRLYGEHAPNRKRYYGDDRDYYRDGYSRSRRW